MPLPSRFVAEAREEFQDQVDHYALIDRRLAMRFTQAVEDEVRRVCEFPAAGPRYEGPYRQRVLPKPFRYSVIFAVEDGVVVIAAVWAHRRNPDLLRDRLRRRRRGT